MDIYVTEDALHGTGLWHYQVWVNGTVYDSFTSRTRPLTWAEQADVAAGYGEGLAGLPVAA